MPTIERRRPQRLSLAKDGGPAVTPPSHSVRERPRPNRCSTWRRRRRRRGQRGGERARCCGFWPTHLEPLGGTVSVAPADAFIGWLPAWSRRTDPGRDRLRLPSPGAPGAPTATTSMEAAAEALSDPTPGRHADAYSARTRSLAGHRRRGPGRAAARRARGPGSGSGALRPDSTPMTALVGWAGGAGRAGRTVVVPLRHRVARRADQ